MAPDRSITDHTRKRLWWHAGDRCAFPGCEQKLVAPTQDGAEDTIVGVECHIVAQRDSPIVARSPSLLRPDERERYAHLIDHRHAFDNLVLMCSVHSLIIDDVSQGFSVEDVVEMKRAHEETISRERQEARARRATAAGLEDESTADRPTLRVLVLDDPSSWQRKSLRKLAETDGAELAWLAERVGDVGAPDVHALIALIQDWPRELEEGSRELLDAVARLAEGAAKWDSAADVWERLASRRHDQRADDLVRAAIDAGVGGDEARRERLLKEAEREDPDSPRLRLERLDVDADPAERLDLLGGIHSDDESLASLIAAHRAIAALMLTDTDQAEQWLNEARALDPDALQVRAVDVNLRVQRARLDLLGDRDFSLDQLEAARREALDLRETMIRMGRWEESARLLMLAADVPLLLRDSAGAERILAQALPEEAGAPSGAEVLGDAALRAGAADLALRLTRDADDSEGIRRIRATARLDRPGDRVEALAELEDLALGGGPEAPEAALGRLGACLPPGGAPWDEEIAQVLRDDGHDRIADGLHVMAVAGSGDVVRASDMAAKLPQEAWAAELRLRVAIERGSHPLIQEAASEFLDFNPDAAGRLLAGQGLAQAGQLGRAAELFGAVAHDPNAPPMVRADAFASLLRALAESDQWARATREWNAWQRLTSEAGKVDGRVSAWQVRIAHHGADLGRERSG